ncbi:putative CD2-binding protein-related [Tripterygium wilfordii]|uniref:Putative CD2-binding protein-related n=1 Tax=Tripterygium wilfordii TaxID=458696 RepID=A0A7J7CH00_TRIWF|nr:protein LIN1 [Tripterygium wilfordii]KAF5733325.1 putative CD2-binding protein-related [Tripterygium wilfordii]
MEEKPPRSSLKRSFVEDDESEQAPAQKRIRFPKGRKVKPGDESSIRGVVEDGPTDTKNDPRFVAKERAKRRKQMTTELFIEEGEGILNDVTAAEVDYDDNDNFVEDGIQIEPFNLNKEREEGYFDADGNFVEYVTDKEAKDAWMDSVEVDPRYAALAHVENEANDESEVLDLSSEDAATIKRRIANLLEPGETVLQALRRLKGTSSNRKEKMSAETKVLFDQLTEDAMKLLENGEYNVYHDRQEVFEREAEGYERLARARGDGTSASTGNEDDYNAEKDYLGIASAVPSQTATEISTNVTDTFDMFAEDNDNAIAKPSSDMGNMVSGSTSSVGDQPSDAFNSVSEMGALQSDYTYDESTGYYYSSILGYYYDPSTGLYCAASTGTWYSFNEETGTYDEIREEVASITN